MERRLAAILAADMVGYSRLMAADEADTIERQKAHRTALIDPKIAQYGGRIVKTTGDGMLVEFPSVVDAVQCAVEIQYAMPEREARVPDAKRIRYRVGINLGDIVIDGEDILGDGVNIAARLEALAAPGGICISRPVHTQIKGKLDLNFEHLGAKKVKNIPEPVTVYQVMLDNKAAATITPIVPAVGKVERGFWPLGVAVIVVAVVAVGSVLWWQPWTAEPDADLADKMDFPPSDKPSIAVLPFDNLSDDPEQEYFADGLTDDLITDLSKISGLFVIARNSVFTYKDQGIDIPKVARELGVRFVLEGSVRRAGDNVRINAQLVDGGTGNHLWAERYDLQYSDIFTIQDEVIESIVEALSVRLTEREQKEVVRLPTHNLEAYDYYLRGEKLAYLAEFTSITDALSFYQKAITLDPNFAEAYAGYARVAVDVLNYGFADNLPSAVARKRAYEAAGRALELNPRLARPYSVLALLQMLESRHEDALASAHNAVTLSPNSAEAQLNLAVVQVYAGRREDALRTMRKVIQLNPKPPGYVHDYHGLILYMNHDYLQALTALGPVDTGKATDVGLEVLAGANARLGQIDAAKAAVQTILKRWPTDSLAWYRVLFAHHALERDRTERLEALRLAGMPEWPHGFEGDASFQLTGDAIDALIDGKTWIGERVGSGAFMQYVQPDGSFIERGADYQLVGTASRKDDMLCLQSPAVLLGRKHCSPIFRNPSGTAEHQNEYTYPNAYELKRFSTTP